MENKEIKDFSKLPGREFSHVNKITGYMRLAMAAVLSSGRSGLNILDMPAGNGLFAENLRQYGHTVTSGDINSERPDFVFVNMERPLPFGDASFDAVVCLEGIEHVISPAHLVAEICRVLKPDGFVILSLPNVQSLYSRLKFLFTGTFYLFDPEQNCHPNGLLIDRGHISPVTLVQLQYFFGEFGLQPLQITGDKIKKKILMPIYLFIWFINFSLSWLKNIKNKRDDMQKLYGFLNSFSAMTGRSLVTVWGKPRKN